MIQTLTLTQSITQAIADLTNLYPDEKFDSLPYMAMSCDQVSYRRLLVREAFSSYVMWGDLESAFNNTSILSHFGFLGPF